MKRYTHPISAIALLLLVLSMLVSACTRSEGGEGATTSGDVGKVITSGQQGTEPFTSTAETTVTVTAVDVTTPAQTMTESPVTTTSAPITTTAPVTTTTTKPPVTTEAPHTHSFSPWSVTKAATCTSSGTEKRTCACGVSEIRAVDASGHSWGAWVETKAPTLEAEGEESRTCSACDETENRVLAVLEEEHEHSFGEWILCDDYINEIHYCACGETETQKHYADPETDEQLVADRVIYYINQFRTEEGSTTAEKLERMTLVAQMRSTQLVGLTASSPYEEWHSTEDLRECCAYYEYGKKNANSTYNPETGEPVYDGTYYYSARISEAVGHNGWSDSTTIDNIAFQIANQIHESSGHWNYVGNSDYSYIAVGVTEAYGYSYFAVFVSDTNQYE